MSTKTKIYHVVRQVVGESYWDLRAASGKVIAFASCEAASVTKETLLANTPDIEGSLEVAEVVLSPEAFVEHGYFVVFPSTPLNWDEASEAMSPCYF